MAFARRTFLIAAVFGLSILTLMFFLEGFYGRQMPPEINHPELYYGFVGVTLAWQIAYLMIGLDPLRYRPFMLLGALAKGSFVGAVAVLVAQGRTPAGPALLVAPDFIFAALFVYAFIVTDKARY